MNPPMDRESQQARAQRVEARLEERAKVLAAQPLLSEEVARDLRARLGSEARSESLRSRRGGWLRLAGGLAAAAALVLLFVLGDSGTRNYGRGNVELQLLEPGGIVLSEGQTLRSDQGGETPALTSCLVEVVPQGDVEVAVRVFKDGRWTKPWGASARSLESEAGWLEALELNGADLRLLVIASKEAIPADLLDEALAEKGWEALEETFGCRVILRELAQE